MHTSRLLPYLWFFTLLVYSFASTGCDSAENDGGGERVTGDYETTQFTAEIEGETVDVLGAGGFIEMTLREDETVSGQLFVPETLAGGEENDFSLDGTYTVSGGVVTFDQEADTFIRDVEWTFEGRALRTETEEITVVLQQQ